ncbi:MAG: ribosomal-processing cysteine protease Prp [Clostridia bacterium]|nr:ribosomal-processing cysteine protease Prp [Clostridia bacterium]
MITVRLQRTRSGFLQRITASGHAGYAGADMDDIVCSAVSAILQTAVGGLQDVAGLDPEYALDDGRIVCGVSDPETLDPSARETARVILETAAVGCRQIEDSYGSRYVTVRETAYIE